MTMADAHSVHIPELISRVEGNRQLRVLSPATYSNEGGHFLDAELYLDDEPINENGPCFLGVGTHEDLIDPNEIDVELVVPYTTELRKWLGSRRANSSFYAHVGRGNSTMIFSIPRSKGNEVLPDLISVILPDSLKNSAGALLNFANVLAFYLPRE